jgi:hypothetical protein
MGLIACRGELAEYDQMVFSTAEGVRYAIKIVANKQTNNI